ncbi:MAG TPA: cytochrome c3 family protein [Kofleriaceae bacterium]|nr:cytochrome c3 family protein [Kofleriaceae bacterium]
MKRGVFFVLIIVAAGAIGASAAPDYATDGPPSDVIFPKQVLPITFSHAKHLARAKDLQCVDCHDNAQDSRSSVDLLTPGEDACTMCHPIDRAQPELKIEGKPPVDCKACHPGFVAGRPVERISIPTPNLKFDHAAHKTTDCKTCHGDLAAEGVGLATRDQLPRMRLCLGCHDDQRGSSACTTCHMADAESRVRITYVDGELQPSGRLEGDAHTPDFRMHHEAAAKTTGNYCGNCHAERFCSDCHMGVEKPMDFHGGDYVTIHAVEARRGVPDCSACHRLQSFCVGCHERSGVGARVDITGAGTPGLSDFVPLSKDAGQRFHPKDYASSAGRGAQHHARDFQRNPQACASCHREDFCITCHNAQDNNLAAPAHNGQSFDPHPRSWRNSAQCEALIKRAGRMCLRCHVQASDLSCDHMGPAR